MYKDFLSYSKVLYTVVRLLVFLCTNCNHVHGVSIVKNLNPVGLSNQKQRCYDYYQCSEIPCMGPSKEYMSFSIIQCLGWDVFYFIYLKIAAM